MSKKLPFNMYYPKGFNHALTVEELYMSYVNDFLTVDAWKQYHYLTDTMVKFILTQYTPMEGND
jgi:hypothetical protein